MMLEKITGNNLITILRTILFMRADFNAANKILYGKRMLDNARQHNLVPEEIFSERNKMADNRELAKVLFHMWCIN